MKLPNRLRYPFKLYWKLLRIHKKTGNWFTRGASVCTILTMRCPLKCDQCPMYMYNGKVKKYEESTFEEWKGFYKRFPQWIHQVYLSGGEPTLYKDFAKLANWLLSQGKHVCVFSNLWRPEAFLDIKPSWRFVVYSTFHGVDKWDRYCKALDLVRTKHRVLCREFEDEERVAHGSIVTKKYTRDWFLNRDDTIHLPPDAPRSLQMFVGCAGLYKL